MTEDQVPAFASPPHATPPVEQRHFEQLEKIAETGNVDVDWTELQAALKTRLEQIIASYQERAKHQEEEQEQQHQQQNQQQPEAQQPEERPQEEQRQDEQQLQDEQQQQQQLQDEQQQQQQQPQDEQQQQKEEQPQEQPEQREQELENEQKQQQQQHRDNDEVEDIQLDEGCRSRSLSRSTPEAPRPKTEPYVDVFDFETSRDEIFDLITSFTEPPFTIQRICELLHSPFKYYDRTSTFFRGLEKNLRVVSSFLDETNDHVNNNNAKNEQQEEQETKSVELKE